ncbi:MCE family protein [Umezawaea endophytica]|uniref:MCE family protein n=1 Tax=Umezawaea endophytica TaxID=1654476 RepID=A0A9X3ACT1_9PSEU|nr:MCE family protein [Umezawaea endophytica]MCS7475397.1 MCE family protein [Umezawaea endophytica]
MSTRRRHQALGVVFLLVAALFVSGSIAVYRKVFTSVVLVRLEATGVGSQLQRGADVKIRGVLVGEVRAVRASGGGAVLDLALRPDKVDLIPSNVAARLLPKTLFGERYVALQVPERPSVARLAAGDVIGQDRSSAAIEIDEVLTNLMPLLQAVQPQKLAATLGAMSWALEGRGARLGDTVVRLDRYVAALNESIPDLNADIAALADVADDYADVAPDLLGALADLTTTSRTLVEQRENLLDLYGSLTTTSIDLGNFLLVNRNNVINLSATARPTLELLARYAPEYPCVLKQLADSVDRADFTFGKGTEHPEMGKFTLEITTSRGKYLPGVDTPRYDDKRGPRCYDPVEPPGKFPQYPPGGPVLDGSTKPSSAGAPALANSPQEQELVGLLLAPQVGVMPEEVPSWGALLVGPLYRGTEVELR